jgi:hypothetical protein
VTQRDWANKHQRSGQTCYLYILPKDGDISNFHIVCTCAPNDSAAELYLLWNAFNPILCLMKNKKTLFFPYAV